LSNPAGSDLMHWMIWHEETSDGISAVLLLLLHFFCSLAMKLEDVFGMHLPSVAPISFGFLEKDYHG
jgi:hypothetical protein